MNTLPYRRCTYATNLRIDEARSTIKHLRTLGFKELEMVQNGLFFDITAFMQESTRKIMYPEDYEVLQ